MTRSKRKHNKIPKPFTLASIRYYLSRLDKPFWHYSHSDWMIVCSGILLLNPIPKILNVQTWFATGFDMSSYNPYSVAFYVPYSFAWLYLSYYQKHYTYLIVAIFSMLYTLLLAYGVFVTYANFPLDPFF